MSRSLRRVFWSRTSLFFPPLLPEITQKPLHDGIYSLPVLLCCLSRRRCRNRCTACVHARQPCSGVCRMSLVSEWHQRRQCESRGRSSGAKDLHPFLTAHSFISSTAGALTRTPAQSMHAHTHTPQTTKLGLPCGQKHIKFMTLSEAATSTATTAEFVLKLNLDAKHEELREKSQQFLI